MAKHITTNYGGEDAQYNIDLGAPQKNKDKPWLNSVDSRYPGWEQRDKVSLAEYKWYFDSGIDPFWNAAIETGGPEVKAYLWRARVDGYSPDRMQFEMETNYKSAMEAAIKVYKNQNSRGPGGGGSGGATKAQQYAAAEAAIRNQAGLLGFQDLSDQSIKSLAQTVVNANWSSDQLNEYLVNGATTNWDRLGAGALKSNVDAVKQLGAQQMIPVSDATAQEIAKKMASGEMDAEGAKNLIREQAKARYTWASAQLQQGVNMRDLLLPSRDALAQEWEMSAEKIDLLDPKVQQLLTVTDKNGQVRMANGAELQLNARKSDNFASTTRARDLAAQTAAYLRNYMEHG